MKILSNSKYYKLIDTYEKEIVDAIDSKNSVFDKLRKLELENFKLKNIIKSYKGVDNKQTRIMIEKLYKRINFALEDINTSTDKIDKLFSIYYGLKGTLEDE